MQRKPKVRGKYAKAAFTLLRLLGFKAFPAIAKLLRTYIPFPILHLYRTYKYNLSTVIDRQLSNLFQNQVATTKKLITKRKTILFYPEFPTSGAIYYICLFLGYNVTNNPEVAFDLCIKWKDATFSPKDPILSRLAAQDRSIVNLNCENISKSHVDEIFHSVFGYSVTIDPLTYTGQCVMKSDLNGQHDGKIGSCPIDIIEPGIVYNKLINNEIDNGNVLLLRVPVFKHIIPFVYLKQFPIEHRFGRSFAHLVSAWIAEASDIFSKAEISKILEFCQKIGLDYGELDVLRDRSDRQLYIVDANNTPSATMLYDPLNLPLNKRQCFLSASDRLIALQKMAQAFKEAFLN